MGARAGLVRSSARFTDEGTMVSIVVVFFFFWFPHQLRWGHSHRSFLLFTPRNRLSRPLLLRDCVNEKKTLVHSLCALPALAMMMMMMMMVVAEESAISSLRCDVKRRLQQFTFFIGTYDNLPFILGT